LYDATVSSACRGNCGCRIVGEKVVVVWLVLLDMEMRCKDFVDDNSLSWRAGTVNRTFNEHHFYCGQNLTHCGRVTQICVFTLQLCRTGDANLRF
jgi:hypothetical protein